MYKYLGRSGSLGRGFWDGGYILEKFDLLGQKTPLTPCPILKGLVIIIF